MPLVFTHYISLSQTLPSAYFTMLPSYRKGNLIKNQKTQLIELLQKHIVLKEILMSLHFGLQKEYHWYIHYMYLRQNLNTP